MHADIILTARVALRFVCGTPRRSSPPSPHPVKSRSLRAASQVPAGCCSTTPARRQQPPWARLLEQGSCVRPAECRPCLPVSAPVSRQPPRLHPTTRPCHQHHTHTRCSPDSRCPVADCHRQSGRQDDDQQQRREHCSRLCRRQCQHAPLILGLRLCQHQLGRARELRGCPQDRSRKVLGGVRRHQRSQLPEVRH